MSDFKDIGDEINIVSELSNKYRDISFKPLDLTTSKLDSVSASQFCDNFRLKISNFLSSTGVVLQTDYGQKENQSKDLNSLDLLNISDAFGIPMVIWQTANLEEMGSEGGHWRLITEIPKSDSSIIEIWDPTGGTVESYIDEKEKNSHLYLNNHASNLGEKYSLRLTQSTEDLFDLEKPLQIDDYNCGTIVLLNGLLRANLLGYVSDENREKIENNFGLKMPTIPPLNAF